MRWLWLTLADPEPATNGQYLYSSGLIRSVAAAGIELDVLALAREDGRHAHGEQAGGQRWWLTESLPRSRWLVALSHLPVQVARAKTRVLERLLHQRLEAGPWDAVVFDSYCHAWAFAAVQQHARRSGWRPILVYLSHNHESGIAWKIAGDESRLFKRQVKRLDALKVARLERRLTQGVDLVTSNSPEDCAAFCRIARDKTAVFLPPGYDGEQVVTRRITDALPRRAIIVGSFDWLPKRVSLEQFLGVADPMFATAGVELHVVGSAEKSLLDRLRQGVIATTLTGRVDNVAGYMAEARVAIVPDRLGGFKLKALDYVFNRLPILAMAGSVPGMPLRNDESILTFPDHASLARGVLSVIDDLPLLNRIQTAAYERCRDQFDWAGIGRQLIGAVSNVGSARRTPYAPTAQPRVVF